MHVTRRAPAKVNLCLLVGPKGESGNHEIFTVFVPVDVYDELEFSLEAHAGAGDPDELRVRCRVDDGEANLAAQALRALEQHTGWAFSGRVEITKRIPVGAGLGGGSSDAALALVVGAQALTEAGGPVPGQDELHAMARELGADVAFFLDPQPAVGRGIGEILDPLPLPEFSLVLVFTDVRLSTTRVYQAFDKNMPFQSQNVFDYRTSEVEKRWRQLEDATQMTRLLENDLEPTSFNLFPGLAGDREILVREGALGALMSGSGPTLFGLCQSSEKAEELQDRLTTRGFQARVVNVVDKGSEGAPDTA